MPNPTDKESSQEEGLLLIEVTRDELEFLEQHRAIYGETIKGETYSERPPYLITTMETPDKIVSAKYHPLNTKWSDTPKKRNSNKIVFGKFSDGRNRLELSSYLNSDRDKFFCFLNGERISLDIDDWRRFFRSLNRIRAFLGMTGKKSRRKRRKKDP